MSNVAARGIDGALVPLRHSLETDAYGFVAHALAVRDGCTSQNCKALEAPARPEPRARQFERTNARSLSRSLFDGVGAQPDGPAPVADAATQSQPTYQPGGPGPRKTVNIDFPTAASIPAVSIMNPEPGTKARACSAGGVCGQSKSAGVNRNRIGAAV